MALDLGRFRRSTGNVSTEMPVPRETAPSTNPATIQAPAKTSARIGDALVNAGIVQRDAIDTAAVLQLSRKDKRLGDILVEMGACTREQIEETLDRLAGRPGQKAGRGMESILLGMGVKESRIREALHRCSVTNEPLPTVMRDFGFLSQELVAQAMSHHSGFSYFDPALIDTVNIAVMRSRLKVEQYDGVVPLQFTDNDGVESLIVGISDVNRVNDAMNTWHNFNPRITIASEETLQTIFRKVFSRTEDSWEKAYKAFMDALKSQRDDVDKDPHLLRSVVGALIQHACYSGASDIQLFRTEHVGVIKLRMDGVGRLFKSIQGELFDRILQKLIMDTNVDTQRLKAEMQEAVLVLKAEDAERYPDISERYNFRVEFGETPRGRTATIRILDKQSTAADIRKMHFDTSTLASMIRYTETSEGLVIVTGPTGSGKTTTLYALLNEIDPVERSVQTIENPIEYRHGLWLQYEVSRFANNEGEGLASILKGLLRNDPDVMLVGEIRDSNAAEIMLHAANTGHLVFTTLHANSASAALTRLQEMDVNMGSLSSVVLGILAQRLVRVLCPYCKEPDDRVETHTALEVASYISGNATPHKHRGCTNCGFSGYRGRRAIYELLDVTTHIREMIETRQPISKIRAEGIRRGHDMWANGMRLVHDGVTSIDEVRRVTKDE